jgi:hypothetical protein
MQWQQTPSPTMMGSWVRAMQSTGSGFWIPRSGEVPSSCPSSLGNFSFVHWHKYPSWNQEEASQAPEKLRNLQLG